MKVKLGNRKVSSSSASMRKVWDLVKDSNVSHDNKVIEFVKLSRKAGETDRRIMHFMNEKRLVTHPIDFLTRNKLRKRGDDVE